MIDVIIAKTKGFIISPVESYRNSRGDEPGLVLPYYIVLLVVHAILTTVIAGIGISTMGTFTRMMPGAAMPVILFLAILIAGIIVMAGFSLWLHLWVYILGGRMGVWQTVKAVIYGMTPGLLLGWIPVVGCLFCLWSLVLQIIGVRELQGISSGRAILAMFIAVMVPLVIIILIALYFMVNTVAFSSVPVAP